MVTIVGGGFAGAECAWALANRGIKVRLYEMRPTVQTGAHKTDRLAELVCSNSFKSADPDSPPGLLKEEMVALGSLLVPVAHKHRVPAGSALAVDRDLFSAEVTATLENHPHISIVREVFTTALADYVLESGDNLVISTGPLTSPDLGAWLLGKTGQEHLYFFDAVAPTVEASSIDMSIAFRQSRYDKGEGDDYINCPFDKAEYEAFIDALLSADQVGLHDFEEAKYFEGCKPIEEIAQKGRDSLRFGNFKPVGLTDPRTGRRPYAVLQLRPENREGTLYSMVACQTRMKWGPQQEVLKLIPGLKGAEFVRLGVMHRNTYLNAPQILDSSLQVVTTPNLYVAGQLTGVEGYFESAAMGLYVAAVLAAKLENQSIEPPPRPTALGSLLSHIQDQTPRDFAPMNINWGVMPDPETLIKDKAKKREWKLDQARTAFKEWERTIAPLARP